jgi:hypothetical protein
MTIPGRLNRSKGGLRGASIGLREEFCSSTVRLAIARQTFSLLLCRGIRRKPEVFRAPLRRVRDVAAGFGCYASDT